uniref:Uncharacterized protein n=1 Tax=Tetranychus urticae TaxID=32264 RepID=T1KKX6_TETUR
MVKQCQTKQKDIIMETAILNILL